MAEEHRSELQQKIAKRRLENSPSKLKHLAYKDRLTGLWNERGFDKVAGDEMEFLLRENFPFSLLYMDIDYFKEYNDEFGHDFGDEVLKKLGQILKSGERKGDTIGRLHGEEFVMLLHGVDLDDARVVAERLREKVENETKNLGKNKGFTISVGVTQYQEEDTLGKMKTRADLAMYQSKQEGRNRVTAAE